MFPCLATTTSAGTGTAGTRTGAGTRASATAASETAGTTARSADGDWVGTVGHAAGKAGQITDDAR